MTAFLVAPDITDSPEFVALVQDKIPAGDFLSLPGGAWLISYEGTSKALAELLLMSEGVPTSGVIVSVGSYWGRATKDVWEWLEKKNK